MAQLKLSLKIWNNISIGGGPSPHGPGYTLTILRTLCSRNVILCDDVTCKKRRKLGPNMGHGNGVNDTVVRHFPTLFDSEHSDPSFMSFISHVGVLRPKCHKAQPISLNQGVDIVQPLPLSCQYENWNSPSDGMDCFCLLSASDGIHIFR